MSSAEVAVGGRGDEDKLKRFAAKRRRDRFLRIVGSAVAAAAIGRYNTDVIRYASSLSLPTLGLRMSEVVSICVLAGLSACLVYLTLRLYLMRIHWDEHKAEIESIIIPEVVASGFIGLTIISARAKQAMQTGVVCGAFAMVYAITQATSQALNGPVSPWAFALSGSILVVGSMLFICVKQANDGFRFGPTVLEPLLFYLVMAIYENMDVDLARSRTEEILKRIRRERPWWFD